MNYLILTILTENTKHGNIGDLKIEITPEGKEYLTELEEKNQYTDEQLLIELLEFHLCNGYHTVLPEHIGALTSSLILADEFVDENTSAEAEINVWWFPTYAVQSYIDGFKIDGFIHFTKVEG